jgi:septal ring factor EnvC (AmiA/AmiB activator)
MFKGKAARVLMVALLGFSLILLPFISGCAKRPSKEELSKLDEAKMAAQAVEKELEAKKSERMDLEKELDEKQRELNDLKADRDKVEKCVQSKKKTQ